jgi:phosphatidylserine decarboxylase
MTLSKFGLREWGLSTLIALPLIVVFIVLAVYQAPMTGLLLALLVFICWLAIVAFFRNPRRKIPENVQLLLGPADGVVKDIEIVEDHGIETFGKEKALRIGIFLSVFNVHLNRASSDLEITCKHYRKGRYLDARHPNCAKENEAMTIGGTANINGFEFPMAIRQISGAIARRIVCPVEIGDKIERGSIYGMIKFGSRTELYIPVSENFKTQVKIGDKVVAGKTIMAKYVY